MAAALEADVRVIPVLVGGAAMPEAPELPEPLQELAYRNAAVIDDRRFPADVRGLINAVSQAVRQPPCGPPPLTRTRFQARAAPSHGAS